MSLNEKNGFDKWAKHEGKLMAKEDLKRLWLLTEAYKSGVQVDINESLSDFRKKINETQLQENRKPRFQFLRPLLKVAAALLIIFTAFFVLKNGLKLTESYETIVAEEGIKKVINLADGSKVILNENSRISFGKRYNEQTRKVTLDGEAFFEVKPDTEKPFQVETGLADITVLGTSFNVRAYKNEESLLVYVNSGKVAVKTKENEKEHLLGVHEQFLLKKGASEFNIINDVNGNAMAWSRGKLVFKNTPFSEVFKTIEKEFKVKINVTNPSILKCLYTQSIELKKSKLKEAFNAMQLACPLKIVHEKQGHYTVSGNCCN